MDLRGIDTDERLIEAAWWLLREQVGDDLVKTEKDFQRRYRPYVQRERILNRIAALRAAGETMSQRVVELNRELSEVNRRLPTEHQL